MALMHETTESVRSAADRAGSTAREMAGRAGERMSEAARRSRETLSELPGSVRRHPYRTAGVAAGVGALAGLLWWALRRR